MLKSSYLDYPPIAPHVAVQEHVRSQGGPEVTAYSRTDAIGPIAGFGAHRPPARQLNSLSLALNSASSAARKCMMERFIRNENIRFYRKLLEEERDEEKRNIIRKLPCRRRSEGRTGKQRKTERQVKAPVTG